MTAMPSPVPMAVRQGTDAWLAARREGVGSSDAPIIAGEKGSIVELWAEKTGLAPRPDPDASLAERWAWGHRLEPVVAEAYTERTGRPLRRANRLLRHPSIPWALASLDRVSARKGERRIVELKITAIDAKYAEGEVPGDVFAQVQHQLWVTGYDVADVAVLEPGWHLGIYEVPRQDDYIDNLMYLESDFWNHVTIRRRPPVDGSENARQVLARLHPRDNGIVIAADPLWEDLAQQIRRSRHRAKAAVDEVGTLENAARALLGDASGVEGGSWRITWKKNADSQRTDWKSLGPVYARTVDTLVHELRGHVPAFALEGTDVSTDEGLAQVHEALTSIYTQTVEGPRVLRLRFKEEE
jgi:putative phage-type endonuclease